MGVGGLPQQTQQGGLRQVGSNLSVEGLVNFNEDGHPRPWLAESWTTSPDGLSLTLQIRRQAKFHDGTPVTPSAVVLALQKSLPPFMGSAFDDIDRFVALDEGRVQILMRQPSRILIEALETPIQSPGKGAGTGPYVPVSASEFRANPEYLLGRPTIDRITVTPYPTVRAAWAELLRGNLDMLYEVNVDALDSLEASSEVAVFSFVRHYQYAITFGAHTTSLEAAAIRRALNAAIDRDAVVRDALNGHGIPSTGPVPPQHWAFEKSAPRLSFNRALATSLVGRRIQFTCLVPADSVYERVALVVKQQLAAASVDMRVEEVTQEQILEALKGNKFEAVLVDASSGPGVFRSFRQFHSKVPFVPKPRSSPLVDAALDRIRHASSDDEYRSGVTAFQKAIVDDPPAIFLAWGERARAVSRRFDVPVPEDGRDVLATLGQWRPQAGQRAANSN